MLRPAVPDLFDQPGLLQARQVTDGLIASQPLVPSIGTAPHPARTNACVQRGDRPLPQTGGGNLAGENRPDLRRDLEPPLDQLRLEMMCSQAEPHPAVGIPVRLVTAPLRLAQRRVIHRGVVRRRPQPFLDAGELRRQDQFPGQHERVQAARHPSVAVPPGMDADQVQMGHRRADEGRRIAITVLEPTTQLIHQIR